MDNSTLQMIANYADIIGAGSILVGLIFGTMQLRHWRAQQRDNIATNITQTFLVVTWLRRWHCYNPCKMVFR